MLNSSLFHLFWCRFYKKGVHFQNLFRAKTQTDHTCNTVLSKPDHIVIVSTQHIETVNDNFWFNH